MRSWIRVLTLAAAVAVVPATFAADAPEAAKPVKVTLVEGQNFHTLSVPEPPETGNRIEVLEAFSYGCVHCFEFEPAMRAWKAHKPADVQLVLLPATFNSAFELYARGYYAAKSLDLADSLHEKVFDTIWKTGLQAKDAGELTNLYVRLGADRDKFSAALASMGVGVATNAAGEKAKRLRLEGTPTLYVDGKYQVLTTGATSYDDIIQRLDAVIARARAERKNAGKLH